MYARQQVYARVKGLVLPPVSVEPSTWMVRILIAYVPSLHNAMIGKN